MNCLELKENFSKYFDGYLEESKIPHFEEHLKNCANCMAEFQDFKRVISSLSNLEEMEAPQGIIADVNSRIDHLKKKEAFWRNLLGSNMLLWAPQAASVVLLLIILGGTVLYMNGMFKNPAKTEPKSINQVITLAKDENKESKQKSLVEKFSKSSEIEIIDCDRDFPEEVNREIERLVLVSKGRILKSRSNGPRDEIIIGVPRKAYSNFMQNLKGAIQKARYARYENYKKALKSRETESFATAKKSEETIALAPAAPAETKMEITPEKTSEDPYPAKTPIPEVRLIKVVFK